MMVHTDEGDSGRRHRGSFYSGEKKVYMRDART